MLSENASFGMKLLVNGQMVNLSIPFGTKRDEIWLNLEELHAALDALPEGVVVYGAPAAAPAAAPAPAATPAPAPAAAAPAAPAAPAANPAPVVAPPAGEGDVASEFDFVQITVEPRADGLTEVQLFGNTHKQPVDKYPSHKQAMKPATWAKFFSPVAAFDESHFEAAATYTLNGHAVITFGKPSSSGARYKNLSRITPLDNPLAPSGPAARAEASGEGFESGPENFVTDEDIPF